jgi:hypothetical protein
LAIITMQMMPKISWPQRVASDAVGREDIAPVVLVITISSLASVRASEEIYHWSRPAPRLSR